ncbi:MAG: CBS domain-containing protein [Desulfosarcina sp.]|nr:CBS domain-containing protein [Desulfosarcina sp.]MBC2744896.1 CBS domain-containing protein [Desulfosarcina sp.]MBC2767804.1 CBS domain-containing protein [Desulfosarcina sp.]
MRDLKTLKACDVMVRPVVSARLNASSRDVALQFLSGLYSGMPITDDEGKVVGVVSELDLLNAVVEGRELAKLTAEELMSKDPVTADVETPVTDIVKLMKEKNVIRLPITSEGKLVGVVARCDILTSIIEPEFVTYM